MNRVESAVKEDQFLVRTSKQQYLAKNMVLATGFYDLPFLLNIPGENLPKVKHYYDEPHPYFGMKIAIVGAANSAVDVALETYRKGAKEVTMVIREDEIAKSVKYWVRPDLVNRIEEGSIKAYFRSSITAIQEHSIEVETPTGSITIENDFVLAMTGYQPDFNLLKSLGIHLGDDEFQTPSYDPATMETNVEGLYLAGVICGGLKTNKWFIENSRLHAEVVIQHIREKQNALPAV